MGIYVFLDFLVSKVSREKEICAILQFCSFIVIILFIDFGSTTYYFELVANQFPNPTPTRYAALRPFVLTNSIFFNKLSSAWNGFLVPPALTVDFLDM